MTETATSETPPEEAPTDAAAVPTDPPGTATGTATGTAPGTPVAPTRSRTWVGVLVVGVLLAVLVGANAVLFLRVRAAQDAADRAALVAATQTRISARLDALDARVSGVDAGQGDTADRVAATGRDVTRLRNCVNDAIDALAKSISSGKATTVTKC